MIGNLRWNFLKKKQDSEHTFRTFKEVESEYVRMFPNKKKIPPKTRLRQGVSGPLCRRESELHCLPGS